jgi:hypothetical protein
MGFLPILDGGRIKSNFLGLPSDGKFIRYFARIDNYPQISEKCGYDLNSEIDLLWGESQNPFLSDDIISEWGGCPVKV